MHGTIFYYYFLKYCPNVIVDQKKWLGALKLKLMRIVKVKQCMQTYFCTDIIKSACNNIMQGNEFIMVPIFDVIAKILKSILRLILTV